MSETDGWPLPPLALVRDALKWCRCCPYCTVDSVPCQGALVVGICDHYRCTCDDEPESDDNERQET